MNDRPHTRNRCPRTRRTSAQGLSLIELLIAMMLLIVVSAATFGVWSRLENTYSFFQDDVSAQEEARMALGEMIELIRTARLPDSVPAEYLDTVIPRAEPQEIWLWTDTDRDVNHDLELIRFYVDDARRLIRQESVNGDGNWNGAAVRIINSNIDNNAANPLFRYYDAAGLELAKDIDGRTIDPTQIREVHIDLRVDIDSSRSPVVHELKSVVQPRNLRQY